MNFTLKIGIGIWGYVKVYLWGEEKGVVVCSIENEAGVRFAHSCL